MADANGLSSDELKNNEDWLNEHGQPDFEFIQALADDGSPEALEKLRAIAEELDAEVDPNGSAQGLVDSIRLASDQSGDVDTHLSA